ncbi:MAG: hypothetical protein ACRD0L_13320 [Acidimicrobiales bacterium]
MPGISRGLVPGVSRGLMPGPWPAAVLALTLLSGSLLTGCGPGGARREARQACQHVQASIRLLDRAQHDATPAQAGTDRAAALQQLRLALPLAAVAATKDRTWEALSTTLSESGRVPEARLAPALTQQCATAKQPAGQPPPPPVDPTSPPPSA